MTDRPIPSGVLDTDRLQALSDLHVLDTPAEPGFDSIVQLTCQICAVPVALVSLVADDRQWFKARVNFPPCETDLNSSVCAHALAHPEELLIIPDLSVDPRTRDNPLVTGEPFIRFYAGAPLVTPAGLVLGTLCAIDKVPRPVGLTKEQADGLKALALQVLSQLELRQAVTLRDALRAEETKTFRIREALMRAQSTINAGSGDLDEVLGTVIGEAMKAIPAADGGAVELVDGAELEYRVVRGTLEGQQGLRLRIDTSFAGRCALTHKPDLMVDAADHPLVRRDLIEQLKLRAAIVAPILRGDVVLGVLKLQSQTPGVFTARDLEVVTLFAGTATAGLAQAEARAAIRSQEARRAALLAVGDRLRDLTTIPEMTRATAEIVGHTLGATRAGFGRILGDVEQIAIEPDWTAPGTISIAGQHRFADYGDIRGHLRRGEALVINDVATDPRTRDDPGPMRSIGINALVNVPVREHGRTVAVFIVHDDRPRTWTADELAFLRNVADRLEVGTARVRAEDQQTTLNHELAHRLKNTLAIVQSIATQTLRGVSEQEMVEAFNKRVLALSRAHDVLLQKSWSAARLRSVMESVLTMQADLDRFALEGADMDISPQAALSLSLLLHELATNALKYGALSENTGKVTIRWRTEEDHTPKLVLDWHEHGGPEVEAPKGRTGFGSKLIKLGLMGTRETSIRYEPLGLRAEFRAPLFQVQQQGL